MFHRPLGCAAAAVLPKQDSGTSQIQVYPTQPARRWVTLYCYPTHRRPVGGYEECAVVLRADDEVGAVRPRVAARDGVREVGQHARRLPRLHVLRGGGQGTMAAAAPALK